MVPSAARHRDAQSSGLPRELAGLFCVLLLGAAVRVLYLVELADAPDFTMPQLDARFHDAWARTLALPDWRPAAWFPDPQIGATPYMRPPGYPWFLALVYALSGGSYLAPRVVQMSLGLASSLLAWRIGRRMGGPLAGILSALGLAGYWAFVYFEGELQATSLLIPLLLGATLALARWAERPAPGRAAVAGLALGLAAVVRPNAAAFLLVALPWLAWISCRRGGPVPFSSLAAICALFGLALVPSAVRNARVSGTFVPISANLGVNLYIGNHAGASGLMLHELPEGLGHFEDLTDYPDVVARVGERLGRPVTYAEASRWFIGRALSFARAHPAELLRLTARKAALYWSPVEITHNKVVALEREHSRVLRSLPGGFAALVAIAVLGAAVGLRRRSAERELSVLTLGLALAWFLSVLPFFPAARYRVPMLPFLILSGALGARHVLDLARRRRWGIAAAWVACGLAVWLAASWSPVPYRPDRAAWHVARGLAAFDTGDTRRASEEFRAALEADPDRVGAHYGLARTWVARGKRDRALSEYRAALRIDPESARSLLGLGNLLTALDRADEAAPYLERAVNADPGNPVARVALAHAHRSAGRLARAQREIDAALSISDGDPVVFRVQGDIRLARGEVSGAIESFERALALAREQGRTRLAGVLRGEIAKARGR